MIIDRQESHFIFVYNSDVINHGEKYTVYKGNPLTNGEVLEYWGKWLVLAKRDRLDELGKIFDEYVEAKVIPCIKYDRAPSGNLGLEECVMMLYCDKRQSEEVWKIVSEQGIKLKAWVSERETMEMWMPGGTLLEMWIQSQNFDESIADEVRDDAGARLGYLFDHPDEVFSPWEQ